MRAFSAIFLIVATLLFASCARNDQVLYEDAQKMWLEERYEDAVSKLRVIVEEYPNSGNASRALFRLGEIHYLNLSQPQKALDFFIRVTEKEGKTPLNLKAQEYIAEIYGRGLRNHELAILQYQRIINEFKGMISEEEYRYKIADSYFHKGDYNQAALEYQNVLDKFPQGGLALDARYQIANCKFIMGNAKEAQELFYRLLQDYPSNKYEYDSRLGIAICYEEMDQHQKALEEYDKIKLQYPGKPLIDKKIVAIKKRIAKKK